MRSRVSGWVREEGAPAAADAQVLVLQDLEERDQTLGRAAGIGEIGHGGLVRGLLLGPGEGQDAALRHGGTTGDDGGPHLRRTGDGGGRPQHGTQETLHRGPLAGGDGAAQMAARYVAGLVRDHARQLVRVLGPGQQPGVEEQVLAAGDEGVEGVVAQNDDVDGVRLEPGGAEDRVGDPRIVSSISASRITVAARAGQATPSSGHQPQCQRQPSHSPVSPAHPHHPYVDPWTRRPDKPGPAVPGRMGSR